MNGTIIFYNLDNGTGLIISENKQKYKFNVELWDDFDNMPEIGLKVYFELEEELITSVVKYEENTMPVELENIDKKIILKTSTNNPELKLDADLYSIKTVPKGFIEDTLSRFFLSLKDTVDKYKNYQLQSDEESLDYFKIKRFLFTAYNNLIEIDASLADEGLMEIYKNIQDINSIHDVYKKSYMYPKIAFSAIFLKHTKYKEAKNRLEENITKIENIKANLPAMEITIKEKMDELSKLDKNDEAFPLLKHSIRSVRRIYVDAIDKAGTLREENEALAPVANEYFKVFFDEFNRKFTSSYQKNIEHLVRILDSMAFLFDRQMWDKASSSKLIQIHFEKSNITYPYSCITFLRYYLKTLNKAKLSEENKELFELLDYLEKRNKKSKK